MCPAFSFSGGLDLERCLEANFLEGHVELLVLRAFDQALFDQHIHILMDALDVTAKLTSKAAEAGRTQVLQRLDKRPAIGRKYFEELSEVRKYPAFPLVLACS